MLSSWRILTTSHKRRQNISNRNLDDNSNREHDLKKHEMNPNDLKGPQIIKLVKTDSKTDTDGNRTMNKKTKLKSGCMLEIGEIDNEYLVENVHTNNL